MNQPPFCPVSKLQKLLLATDGSEHGRAAVAEAVNIAKRCGCSVIGLSSGLTDSEMQEARLNVSSVAERVIGLAGCAVMVVKA